MATTAARTEIVATRKFVVGVDGSADSQRALRWAEHLAGDDPRVRIVAVYVCDLPVVLGADWHYLLPGWDPMDSAKKVARKTIDEAFGGHVPARVDYRVVQGHPVVELLAFAKDAELLLVGSRGLGAFSKLLLGSVGGQCVQHAHCPVLVVHGDEPPTASTAASAGRTAAGVTAGAGAR